MTYLGLNLGLEIERKSPQLLWNDGGQGRS